jgi:hypothetical protein
MRQVPDATFFSNQTIRKKIKKIMKLTGLSFTEQTLVFVLAKLYSIDKEAINEFKDEVSEEIWDLVTTEGN